jgi:hypothetical protein
MKTQQNIIKRLQDAANIMHEHAQYKDEEFEHNGDGLAAQTCEDAADIIKELLSALEAIKARINGVYDCPALVAFGPLQNDTQLDCLRIADEAIAKAKGETK